MWEGTSYSQLLKFVKGLHCALATGDLVALKLAHKPMDGVTSISCSETVPNVVQQCGCGCSRAECPTLVMGNHKDC